MFSFPLILLLIALFVLALPIVLLVVLFQVAKLGFEELGLPPEVIFATLVFMLVGSFINIPLGPRRYVRVEDVRFFGLLRRSQMKAQGLAVNIGGGIIPVLLALYLFPRVPLPETLLATALMAIISYRLARFVPGRGVALPVLLPPLCAALLALILAFDEAAPVAFVSGVFGVLLGADILYLPRVFREGSGVMSIGGAGVFDGIFLIAIFAAFLAGL